MRYNEAGAKALDQVQKVIDSIGLPLDKARKFNAILDAIETQIEDYEYTDEVVKGLDRALLALASLYGLGAGVELERALAEFERKPGEKR